ncbi:allose kinase [Peptoniphilaceae bacterium SGI.131]
MNCVIGIDIGGTNLRIGTVWDDGRFENFLIKSSKFLNENRADILLSKEISEYIEKNNLKDRVRAITIGVPSSVSKDKKKIYSTPNIKGLDNVNLTEKLEEYLKLPIFLDRDVNFLLMNDIVTYELDKTGRETILGMYLGTGFGNAIYINGNIYEGKNGVAGELGHIPLYGVDDLCACGNTGCTETRVSGRYLAHIKEECFADTSFEDLFVDHKDSTQLRKFIDDIGLVIATEINILDPDYVILAGGVISMNGFPKAYLLESINKRLRRPYPLENIEYIFAEHKQESGVRGGYYYVDKYFNKNA